MFESQVPTLILEELTLPNVFHKLNSGLIDSLINVMTFFSRATSLWQSLCSLFIYWDTRTDSNYCRWGDWQAYQTGFKNQQKHQRGAIYTHQKTALALGASLTHLQRIKQLKCLCFTPTIHLSLFHSDHSKYQKYLVGHISNSCF